LKPDTPTGHPKYQRTWIVT